MHAALPPTGDVRPRRETLSLWAFLMLISAPSPSAGFSQKTTARLQAEHGATLSALLTAACLREGSSPRKQRPGPAAWHESPAGAWCTHPAAPRALAGSGPGFSGTVCLPEGASQEFHSRSAGLGSSKKTECPPLVFRGRTPSRSGSQRLLHTMTATRGGLGILNFTFLKQLPHLHDPVGLLNLPIQQQSASDHPTSPRIGLAPSSSPCWDF